jgi:plastocyanin
MSKKWTVGIVVIIVVLGAWFLFSSKSTTTYAPTQNELPKTETQSNTPAMEDGTVPQVVTVTYSDNGYSPATVNINVGDAVKFVNESSGKMWVASAPHPAHTDYPEFDEKSAVSKGGTYEFTFTKVGSWKYHNHAKATHYGLVVVK